MAIWLFSDFSHLRPGPFYIALQAHNIHNRVEERRTNKHGLGLAPSARREKFVTLLCSLQCIWLSRAKFLHSHQECWLILMHWLTWLLSPQVPIPRLAVVFLWSSPSPDFCWLLSPVDCILLFTAQGPCFPSSSSGFMGNLMHKPFVWVSR